MLELNIGGRRKTLAMAFAAAVCATVLTLQGASAAQAASPYDGADPAATGCSSNAKTLASAPVCLPNTTSQVGTIEWSLMVYTSNTRSCGTGSADTGVNTAYPYGERGRQICG